MTQDTTPAAELAAWMNEHNIRPRTMGFYMAQTQLGVDVVAVREWEAATEAGWIEDPDAIPTEDGRMVAFFAGDETTGPGWYADDSGERAIIEEQIEQSDAEARRDWAEIQSEGSYNIHGNGRQYRDPYR